MTKENFKKINLTNIISKKTGFSHHLSKKITEDLLNIFKENIKNGNLHLKNFGSFKILYKGERLGRNPKTKKEYIISARKTITFKPSKKIIDHLNKFYE